MTSVQQILNSQIEKKSKPWDTTKHFYVSDMNKCYRMRIFKRLGLEPTPVEPRTKLIFAIGNINHSYLQRTLKQSGVLIAEEMSCYWPLYELSGRCDAIIKDNSSLSVVEFKNTHSRKIIYGSIDDNYVMQALTYVHLLKNRFAVDRARVVLISRDDWIFKEEVFFLTKTWMDKIYRDLITLWHYWQVALEILPPELNSVKDKKGKLDLNWECKYCGYLKYCPNIVALKKERDNEVPSTRKQVLQHKAG